MMIRPLAAADFDAVIRFAALIPEAPHWPRPAWESYATDSTPPRRIFLAESGGELTGFIAGQIVAGTCELESIAVAPTCRGSGIGKALFGALAEWAVQFGASKIQLEVRAGNHSAIGFYRNFGFRRDGLRRRYYQDPEEDALLMTRPLAPRPPG